MIALLTRETWEADAEEWKIPDGYEVVDGEPREVNMGAKSIWIATELASILTLFRHEAKLGGWVLSGEVVMRCFPHSKKTARKADICYFRKGRFPKERLPDGDIRIIPDLVVEVIAPHDEVYEVEAKLQDYLQAGIPLIWVIVPPTRSAYVYRADGSLRRLTASDELDGEDVLPGFRCRLDSFLPPPLEPEVAEVPPGETP